MSRLKVAIQGQRASFHDEATHKILGNNIDIAELDNFKAVFKALKNQQVDRAVVAIENSLYGSINEVYDLVLGNNVWICAETYIHVSLCLIGYPGSKIEDIKEIYSHPIALAECGTFFGEQMPDVTRHETHDTAGSVKFIQEIKDISKGAVASKKSAKLYGMSVLAEEIEDNKSNYTRFVVLGNEKVLSPMATKTSIVLTTSSDNKPGSLYKALGVLAENNINLTLLHSRPIIGRAWHYMFYVDLEVSSQSTKFQTACMALKEIGYNVRVLGSYRVGIRPE